MVKNNQDIDFNDKSSTNIESIAINRNSASDNELANKKYIDDDLDKNTVLRFNQTLENYLKVSDGKDIHNLTVFDKKQITDTTVIKAPNTISYLIPIWKIECNDRNNNGKIQNFIKSTKTNSPTSNSGAISLPPIGNAFMYIDTSSNNFGDGVYVILERTDIIKNTNITFYYDGFSILIEDSLKSMLRFTLQLLIDNNIWKTRHHMPQKSNYNSSSTDWSLNNLDFTEENYGSRMYYDQIDTAHVDICFSKISIQNSVD